MDDADDVRVKVVRAEPAVNPLPSHMLLLSPESFRYEGQFVHGLLLDEEEVPGVHAVEALLKGHHEG